MTREIVTCKFWIHKKKGEFEPDPKAKIDPISKCEIYIQAKHVRKPFFSTYRTSEPLELMHSDVSYSNRALKRGEKVFCDIYTCPLYVLLYFLKVRIKS